MIRNLFVGLTLAGLMLVAGPVVIQETGIGQVLGEVTAEAAARKRVKKVKVVRGKAQSKYTYQYIPTSSGRPGAWR